MWLKGDDLPGTCPWKSMWSLGFGNEKHGFSYENSSIFIQVGKSIFSLHPKILKKCSLVCFYWLCHVQMLVLHLKVYDHFSLAWNYLVQFYHKKSNRFVSEGQQTCWEIILSKDWVENTVAEILFFSPLRLYVSQNVKYNLTEEPLCWIIYCLLQASVWSKKALFTSMKLLN